MNNKAAWLVLIGCVMTARMNAQQEMADSVRAEFVHAWDGYKQYAWGHDALRPLSRTPRDWYGRSLCMTPVDAYDAMLIMGLTDQAAEAKKLILDSLSFNKNIEVQNFEITIRLLGGLLSAYWIDRDKRLLAFAQDLGDRLLPVFNTHTGMPYRYVNLQSGRIRDSINNPAEIGTSLLEFGTLSKLTGNPVYYDKSKKALIALYARRSSIGLVGSWINVETGDWVDSTSHIGGGIDSYYEYLYKAWLLFGDEDCKKMADETFKAVNRFVVDTTFGSVWYGHVAMGSGKRTATLFGSLEAFYPALLSVSGDTKKAVALERSCFKMWTLNNIEPEEIDYSSMKVTDPAYHLRPEIIESAYYLYRITGNGEFPVMGEIFFNDLVKYCRTDLAYAALGNVTTKEKTDEMESFFFAETLKYLYLLFAPPEALDFSGVVFNTEAHPLHRVVER